jgi:transposase-like protein
MMKSSEARVMEDVRPAITAMQKLEALAALERTPARSKDIAKELGVSEILLYRWKTQFEDGGELTDEAPTPTAIHTKPQAAPALPPPPADLPARTVRTYTEEQKRAAVESFLAGGISLSECGSKHDVNPKTLEYWVQVARSKLPPSREKGYRSVAKREEVQREYREDLTASIPKLAKKHRISKSTVWEWCKDIRKSSNQKVLAHAASVKEEAIAAYLQGDESETAIAKRLEIGRTTLSGWIKVATGLAEPPKPVGREPLTELRDRVVAEFREGLLGTSELAVKHNVHPKTVATWIRRALLSTGSTGYGNHSKYTPEFRYKVGKAVLDGMSSAAAARQFGMDQGGRSALDWAQAIRERRLRAPEENTDEMPAHRKYPDEKRAAVLADIDAGMAEKDAALKHDVPKGKTGLPFVRQGFQIRDRQGRAGGRPYARLGPGRVQRGQRPGEPVGQGVPGRQAQGATQKARAQAAVQRSRDRGRARGAAYAAGVARADGPRHHAARGAHSQGREDRRAGAQAPQSNVDGVRR